MKTIKTNYTGLTDFKWDIIPTKHSKKLKRGEIQLNSSIRDVNDWLNSNKTFLILCGDCGCGKTFASFYAGLELCKTSGYLFEVCYQNCDGEIVQPPSQETIEILKWKKENNIIDYTRRIRSDKKNISPFDFRVAADSFTYLQAGQLKKDLQKTKYKESSIDKSPVYRSSLVILDELGAELTEKGFAKDEWMENFELFINNRYEAERKTILVSNLGWNSDLGGIKTQYSQRIIDRIEESYILSLNFEKSLRK